MRQVHMMQGRDQNHAQRGLITTIYPFYPYFLKEGM
jgi:hypothetical protein